MEPLALLWSPTVAFVDSMLTAYRTFVGPLLAGSLRAVLAGRSCTMRTYFD